MIICFFVKYVTVCFIVFFPEISIIFVFLFYPQTNNSCPQDRIPFLLVFVRKHMGGRIIRKVAVEEVKPDDIPEEEEDPTFCEVRELPLLYGLNVVAFRYCFIYFGIDCYYDFLMLVNVK